MSNPRPVLTGEVTMPRPDSLRRRQLYREIRRLVHELYALEDDEPYRKPKTRGFLRRLADPPARRVES